MFALLWDDKEQNQIRLRVTYNHLLVTLIYKLVPKENRLYDYQKNEWTISKEYTEKIIGFLERLGYRYTWMGGDGVQLQDDFAVLHLLPNAPWPVCQAVYKALVKMHHPDSGGSNEKMAEINGAFDRIKLIHGFNVAGV